MLQRTQFFLLAILSLAICNRRALANCRSALANA